MRISCRHKFIALDNPNCGFAPIGRALDPFSDDTEGLHPHAPLRTIQRHVEDRGRRLDEFYVFATVLNPWERAVDIYVMGRRVEESVWHGAAQAGFSAFLKSGLLDRAFRPKSDGRVVTDGPYDARSFCADRSDTVRANIFDAAQTSGLQAKLSGLGIYASLPRHKPRDYRSFYTNEEDIERVRHLFENDIAMFGSELDGPAERPLYRPTKPTRLFARAR